MSNPRHVLFLGAGASYGSEVDKSLVPPLGATLFAELLRFESNVWGQIPDDIAATFHSDFESGVLALNARMPHALPVAQRSMAAFFYRYAPTSRNLYVKLAKKIRAAAWQGAIATLNYERMLLLAASQEGVALACGVTDLQDGQVELCLPHGCCHLFCESVKGSAAGVSMAGMNLSTSGPVTNLDHPDAFWSRLRNDAFPPVMSYFEPRKFTTSGANFIGQQRQRLTELIANAETIAVVGIQVRERDSHIWDALAATDASMFYCSGKQGANVYEEWRGRVRHKRNDNILSGYWADEFDAINAHLGL